MAYASRTKVPVERSKAELEKILARYGATTFMHGWSVDGRAMVQFEACDRRVRLELGVPTEDDARSKQLARARWRSLVLIVKANLEAVDAGVSTFEEEFLAHVILPSGLTVAQTAVPAIGRMYETGKMQPLLPEATG